MTSAEYLVVETTTPYATIHMEKVFDYLEDSLK